MRPTFAAMDRLRDFHMSDPNARWTPRSRELEVEFETLLEAEAVEAGAWPSRFPEEAEEAAARHVKFGLDWTAAYEAHAAATGKPVGS